MAIVIYEKEDANWAHGNGGHSLGQVKTGNVMGLSKNEMSAHILAQANYKPGGSSPEGYLAWHEWAGVQHKAGLKQCVCGRCACWQYAQELSGKIDERVVQSSKGQMTIKTPICKKCFG